MAGAKNHDYHILPPDIWPLFGSFSAFVMAIGGIRWMHDMAFGALMFYVGCAAIGLTFYSWWSNVIKEAHAGDHTPVVQLHLRYGMILFIASEVMFFVGWFWAWSPITSVRTALLRFCNGRPKASKCSTPLNCHCSTR